MLTLNLSNDYKVLDGLAPVNYYPATAPEIDLATSVWSVGQGNYIPGARIEKIVQREVQVSAGVYTRLETRFRLPTPKVHFTPKPADIIRDSSGQLWTVYAVGFPRFGSAWTCDCLRLSVAAALSHSLTWLAAVIINRKGSKTTSHVAQASGIAGRIQPLSANEILIQARQGFDVDFAIYTEIDIDVKFQDLLQNEADGTKYEIKGFAGRKSLMDLSSYLCKRRP